MLEFEHLLSFSAFIVDLITLIFIILKENISK